jgi:sugar phosphate isomerase/epimerase
MDIITNQNNLKHNKMENNSNPKGKFSRRKFVGGTAALAAVSLVPFSISSCNDSKPAVAPVPEKPTSIFGGVQIGTITYSWRSMPGGVENVIKYCKEAGLTSIELMSNDVEEFLGAPKNPMMAMFSPPPPPPKQQLTPGSENKQQGPPPQGLPTRGPRPGGPKLKLTPEQEATIKKYNEDVKTWRLALPISKFESVKKMFDDAGIGIHIVKFSPARWSDEEIDYAFKAAKAMGAKGVTEEIGEEAVKKLGPIAEKHGMYAIFHSHMQFATPGFSYDPFMAVSPAVMFNFDAGHFFGSTGLHPNTIIEKYHKRIFSIHLKDKTGPNTDPGNTNQVWGQGEMPIAEVLQLIQKNKWPIYCDIELEYDIKPWSNAVKETKICKEFTRQILM